MSFNSNSYPLASHLLNSAHKRRVLLTHTQTTVFITVREFKNLFENTWQRPTSSHMLFINFFPRSLAILWGFSQLSFEIQNIHKWKQILIFEFAKNGNKFRADKNKYFIFEDVTIRVHAPEDCPIHSTNATP
jgi:hypothetical protein